MSFKEYLMSKYGLEYEVYHKLGEKLKFKLAAEYLKDQEVNALND